MPRLAVVWGSVVLLTSCQASFAALTQGGSTERGEQLFAALGARVTEPLLDRKYDVARVKIANSALIPSRVWHDTSVWTSTSTSRRTLLISGRFSGGRYRLEAARTVPPPSQPAESRHVINLTRLSDDEYAWDTEVPYAIGTVTAREVGAFVAALFASAEGRTEKELRADFGATAPRTTATLAQLFTLDSVTTTRLPDNSTLATYAISMHPDGIATRSPGFAEYLRRYAMTARMRWTLSDRARVSYLDVGIGGGRLTLKVRTLNGDIVSLTDAARPMPDSLTLHGELSVRVRRITVGFRDYRADFNIVRTDRERAWNIVSRQVPEWTLPVATERLLRTPLRRPFQGRGAQFRIGVRDSSGAQTILMRRMHLEVQESAILRFIGKLGATAVADYKQDAEAQQLVWLREVFAALVADIQSFGSRNRLAVPTG